MSQSLQRKRRLILKDKAAVTVLQQHERKSAHPVNDGKRYFHLRGSWCSLRLACRTEHGNCTYKNSIRLLWLLVTVCYNLQLQLRTLPSRDGINPEESLLLMGSLMFMQGLFTDNEMTLQPRHSGAAGQPVIDSEETCYIAVEFFLLFLYKDRIKDTQ